MSYSRVQPSPALSRIVECIWLVEDDDAGPRKQKIIPDGYPELIFHFGDPYRICIDKTWGMQSRGLVAGQVSKHFYLENTGRSEILGVKLQPAALTHLFGFDMKALTDQVADINLLPLAKDLRILQAQLQDAEPGRRPAVVEAFFHERVHLMPNDHPVDLAVSEIFTHHGMLGIQSLAAELGYTQRHIEQLFQKFVGLTPKFFARVVRFAYIFRLISDNRPDWSDVVLRAGFYDQSHFIRNFKSFTGEDPSKYLFEKKDLANFFLS
jgi:methylphosphotriester-DNA--protein-cysteine methyltransferase